MKVLHVYRTYFPDPPGGLQEAIRQICLASNAYGVESKVFTLSPNPIPERVVRPEAEIIRRRSWAAPASCDLGGLSSLTEFARLSNWADVVHFHFPWPFGDILNFFRGANKPAIMTYHSDIVRQKTLNLVYRPLMLRTMRSMSAVVATSPVYASTSRVLVNDVPASSLRSIPLGIVDYATGLAQPNAASEKDDDQWAMGEPFLLALGVLRYYKGLHTLVEAAELIKGKVIIAGSGPEEGPLKELVKQLGLSNVIFTGQVTEIRKISLLRQCRALVLPSHLRSEAFGMVLVEASMFSKPMVCCEVGSGTSYVNLDQITGFVVQPESPLQLAGACNRLLENETLAKSMGIAARQRYEELFSGSALGRAYSALYKQVSN